MSTSTTTFFVPTLDIDLAWHTHQLMGPKYSRDCKAYIRRTIDQYVFWFHRFHECRLSADHPLSDDKVEEEHLALSFDVTCRAWQV